MEIYNHLIASYINLQLWVSFYHATKLLHDMNLFDKIASQLASYPS